MRNTDWTDLQWRWACYSLVLVPSAVVGLVAFILGRTTG